MRLNRREFLLTTAATPVLAARRIAQGPLLDRGFGRVVKLTDGVYATIADPTKGQQCLSNGGVLVGRDATVIVEGHFQAAGAALEIEAARAVSNAPIRAAIDTHFHLDHSFGNPAYAAERIPIMAHDRVPSLMKEHYAALKGVDKGPLVATLERKLAVTTDAEQKKHVESDVAATKWFYAAIDAATLAYPTELLAPADLPKRIDLGGLTAIVEFHPGHSPTDLIIRVPEREVVFTGDLLFYRAYPVSVSADLVAWRRVLDRFSGYPRQTRFVPGHGAVCGVDVVREQADLMDDLRSHAKRMMRAGATAEEAERRYLVPKAFATYGVFSWNWTIGAALQSYYAALRPMLPAV
jgi:cyclase